MATREQLEKALRNADAAGDTAAAQQIAEALKAMPKEQQSTGPIQALDDMLRLASNGLTLGFRDKLAQYVGGAAPDEQRRMTQEARDRAGGAGTLAEVGGALAPSMMIPNLAPAAMERFSSPIAKFAASLGVGALEGSALGGVNAVGHDQNVIDGILQGGLFGALGTAASSAVSKGANMLDDAITGNPNRMTVDDLRIAKEKAYKDVKDAGVEYTPGTMDRIIGGIDDITDEAWPIRHPQTIDARNQVKKVLQNERVVQPRGPLSPQVSTPLGTVPGAPPPPPVKVRKPVSLTRVDQTRQAISKNLANLPDPAEAQFGRRFIDKIDEVLHNTGPTGVTTKSGDPLDGIDLLDRAHSVNSRMRKLEQVDESITRAERRAQRNLQSGEDTTIRANIESILNSPAKRRGFSPDEIAKMEEVVRGTGMQNMLRQIGRVAPGGGLSFGGAGFGAAAGGAVAGTPGAIIGAGMPGAVGILAKKASERSTRKSADDLLTLIASGGNAAALKKPKLMNKDAEKMLARFFTQLGIQGD